MKALAAAACLAAGLLPAAAASAPEGLIVRYQMLFGGLHIADVEDRLEFSADSTYRFSSRATAIGLAALIGSGDVFRSSSGQVDAAAMRLEVDSYFHQRKDAEQESRVDRGRGMIDISYKGSPSTAEFEPEQEIVDPLTMNYLFHVFPERAEADAIDVLFTDGKRGKPHLYRRLPDTEKISIPAGEFDAVRFDRKSDDRSSSVWFVPELGMLPGRILLVADSRIEFLLVGTEAVPETEDENPNP